MEAGQTNIKERLRLLKKPNNKAFGAVADPIAQEISSQDTLEYLANGIGYIPYYTDGDGALSLFQKLRRFSPTHGAIIESQKRFATGWGVGLIAEDSSIESFEGFVSSWGKTADSSEDNYDELEKTAQQIHDNLKTYGNAYIEIVITKIAGQSFASLKVHAANKCRYVAKDIVPFDNIMISPVWNQAYLAKHKPEILPVYPAFTNESNGMVKRTIIHVKNETLGREIYGEPDSMNGLYFHYLGYQLGAYTVEGYDSEWVAQFFIETVGDPEDDTDNEGFSEAMEATFSRKGTERRRVMHRHRGIDTEATKIHEFSRNSDEKFHAEMGKIADARTFKAHDWHPVLMESTAGSLGQGNEFEKILKTKYQTVIKPQQRKIDKALNKIVRIIASEFNYDLPESAKVMLNMPFPELLNAGKKASPQEVTSVTDLVTKVQAGEISKESAAAIMSWAYQMPQETIDNILN